MKKLLIIFLLLIHSGVYSQNIYFIKSYGNNGYDFGRDIKQDIDTGYIATGSSSSFYSGNADAFLLKVDSLGNFKWSYNYGGPGSEWGEAVVTTSDSAYAIGGYTNSSGAGGFDFYLVRTDQTGSPIYEKTYGGSDWDKAYDMIEMPDKGFVLVGETYSYGQGNNDIYIVRTDMNGDTLWTRTYGGTDEDFANALLLDGDSLVIVGGTKSFGNGMTDGIILKYHIDGTLGWVKTAGMEREDYFTSITSNFNGEYFLGGTRHYYFDSTGYLGDFWIYNMHDTGQLIADTSITGGSHEFEIAHGIAVDDNDNIFFAGSTKSYGYATIDGLKDAFVGRLLNNYYQTNYINNFGVAGNEVAHQLRNTSDEGFIAVGDIEFLSDGGNNLFILKIDKDNTTVKVLLNSELEAGNDITLTVPQAGYQLLSVYPTLVTESINIIGLTDQNFEVIIYNLEGQKVMALSNEYVINAHHLTNGYYILKLVTKKSVYTTKFVKTGH